MKTRSKRWLVGLALATNAAVGMAGGIDPPVFRPPWRGQEGTTFQKWGFDATPTNAVKRKWYGPEVTPAAAGFRNPGTPVAIITPQAAGIGWFVTDAAFKTNTSIPGWVGAGAWDLGYGGGTIVLRVPDTRQPAGSAREVWVQWVEATVPDWAMTNTVAVEGGTLEASGYERRGIETNDSYTWWVVRTKWRVPPDTALNSITISGGCANCNSQGGGQAALVESVVVDTLNERKK